MFLLIGKNILFCFICGHLRIFLLDSSLPLDMMANEFANMFSLWFSQTVIVIMSGYDSRKWRCILFLIHYRWKIPSGLFLRINHHIWLKISHLPGYSSHSFCCFTLSAQVLHLYEYMLQSKLFLILGFRLSNTWQYLSARYCYYCLRIQCATAPSFRCSRCREPVVGMQRHGSVSTQ